MITLVPYNSEWPELFAAEKLCLQQTLVNIPIAIEHISSTAIPGIQAKSIIDILIGIANLEQFNKTDIENIIALNYQYCPEFETSLPYRPPVF